MHATRANSKAEADPILDEKFVARFCTEPEEAVVWAFTAWRDQSPFFPSIWDIGEFIKVWKRTKRDEDDVRRRREEQADIERRRAAGEELVTLDEVKRILKEAADKSAMGDGPRIPRSDELCVRPPLELSRHEWELRRNTEKARLSEYLAAKG